MKVTKFAINHATAVYVLIFCLTVGGVMSYFSLPREAAPEIAIPILIVSTPYIGVSPADIETLVTEPMESEFKSLRDVKKMTSTSAEGVSLVTIEFEPEVDIDDALQKVREKVDKVQPELPPDAEETSIIEINSSDWPVLIANVSGDLDLMRLKEIGEGMQDKLEKIPGVLRVDLAGGVEREVQIFADPEKLRHHGISLGNLIKIIQSENSNLPGGSIEIGSMKYLLRVPGEFEDTETIEDLVIKAPNERPVYVRDVAEVKWGYKERSTYSRLTTWQTLPDGSKVAITQPNISLSVVKRAGENIIDIAEQSKDVIAQFEAQLDKGVNIAVLNDMSRMIKARVHDLENNIISGLVLVLGILFFFMGGARNALFVAVSIPLSMLISFIVLSILGITLNMVVLFSLVLALGMLVDNAIVIVENIYRHASEGKPRMQAAYDGTAEVGWAVIASTATTVAAFFPLTFWPGVMGKFMGFLPKTVIITLLSSLFVALVINPVLCATLLKVKEGEAVKKEDEVPDNLLYRTYFSILNWCLNYRLVVAVIAVASLIGTFVIYGKTARGVEFFPDTTPEQFMINIERDDGTRLEATDDVVRFIEEPLDGTLDQGVALSEEKLSGIREDIDPAKVLTEAWVTDVGTGGGQGMVAGGTAPHLAKVTVDMIDIEDQPADPLAYMQGLREIYETIPGANVVLERQKMGPPAGAPVSIEIVGEDLKVLARLAREIREKVRTIPGIIDLDDDIELTRPEVQVIVDRQRAAMVKLDTRQISQTVRTAVNGTKASVWRDGEDEYDITVRLQEDFRNKIADLEQLTVTNPDGVQVPLIDVADIVVGGGTGSIRHKDQERVVSVTANAADGYLPNDLLKVAEEKLEDLKIPAGYQVRFAGEQEDQKEAQAFLGTALLAALFLIILILVTEFNSILQPAIIMVSVILSLIGVLWSLIITGEPFGIIMTGIGIISLAGVVVNNAIVLIDYANRLRERGLDRRAAILTAGQVRLRPVLLTAVTTVLGLVPLVVGVSVDFVNLDVVVGGGSVELWSPMAKVVTAGLLVATVLTLLVVPVLYSLLDDISHFFRRLFRVGAAAGTVAVLISWLPGILNAQVPREDPNADPPGLEAQELESPPEAQPPEVPAPEVQSERLYRVPSDMQSSENGGLKSKEAEDELLRNLEIPAERVLTLEKAQERVKKENFDVRLAATQVMQAQTTIDKAWSVLFPTLALQGTTTIYNQEVAFQVNPMAPPQVVRPQVDWRVSASASMRLNARAYPLIQQAYLQEEVTQLQLASLREELQFAVAQTYYNLLVSRRVMEIASTQLQNNRTLLRATQLRQRAGTARPFESTRAELRVVAAEKDLERAKLQFIQLRQALAQILQTPANFEVQSPGDVDITKSPEELKDLAVTNRYKVDALDKQTHIADLAIEEMYWQYLPAFSVAFTAFRVRAQAFQPDDLQWQVSLTADWTLWDGGLREATIDEREAQLLATKLRYEKEITQLYTDIEQAWAEYLSALAQAEASEVQIALAQDTLRESLRAYELGAATQLDVINAEDQLQIAQITQAQDHLQLQLAIRKLKYLAGLEETQNI